MRTRIEFCHSGARHRNNSTAPAQTNDAIADKAQLVLPEITGNCRYLHTQRNPTPMPYPAAKESPETIPCISGGRGSRLGVRDAAKKTVPSRTPVMHNEFASRMVKRQAICHSLFPRGSRFLVPGPPGTLFSGYGSHSRRNGYPRVAFCSPGQNRDRKILKDRSEIQNPRFGGKPLAGKDVFPLRDAPIQF